VEIAREKLEELVLREGSVDSKALAARVVSNGLGVARSQMVSEKSKQVDVSKSTKVKEKNEECWSSVDEDEPSEGEMYECPTM
jgi:predicted rRNA methylase YqxC with S4 and FtsJ domains